jgi:hypothetical protein
VASLQGWLDEQGVPIKLALDPSLTTEQGGL